MNYSILKCLVPFLLFFGKDGFTQELLSVEEAVTLALENNYEIRIAKNELKIDQNGVSLGYAGMLPKVDASIVDNNNIQNITQVRSDGTRLQLDNGKNNSLNYGVRLDWTLFDGFGMFARYEQLEEFERLGEIQLKQSVLEQVSLVMITYFELVQQKQQLTALDSTLVISQQRVELAKNRFIIGKASKLEVLNAEVDLNTDQTQVYRQRELHANTKKRLNEILVRDIELNFTVVDGMLVDETLMLPDLEQRALDQNPQLQAEIINKRISELELKKVRAARYPILTGNTGYQFNESTSSLGFTSSASTKGLNYGFSARMNLFDGSIQNRNEKTAKLKIENSEIVIERQEQSLKSAMGIAYQTYLTNLQLIALEENNQAIAKENLEITLDKFKIGTIPTIEFRTAQLNYINAKVRFSEAIFQAKLSEITLKELAGNLSL